MFALPRMYRFRFVHTEFRYMQVETINYKRATEQRCFGLSDFYVYTTTVTVRNSDDFIVGLAYFRMATLAGRA